MSGAAGTGVATSFNTGGAATGAGDTFVVHLLLLSLALHNNCSSDRISPRDSMPLEPASNSINIKEREKREVCNSREL